MKTLCVAAALLALAAPAAAQIYRWTDAEGVVHYTQTPPPSGNYQAVTQKAPPPSTAPAVDAGRALLQRADAATRQRTEAESQALAAAEPARKVCEAARKELGFLDTYPPRRQMVVTEGGEASRMTTAQWEARRAEVQKLIDDQC